MHAQVWREKGLLFCLSDEGINAHHLPAFKLACQAGRTRGANAFAFDEGRAMLAVATKRCVLRDTQLESALHARIADSMQGARGVRAVLIQLMMLKCLDSSGNY